MPSVQFDNRISWVDIIALAGVAASALYGFFGYGASIEALSVELDHQKETIERVEKDRERGDKEIAEQIGKVREEQTNRFDKLDGKLDQLILRELDRHSD